MKKKGKQKKGIVRFQNVVVFMYLKNLLNFLSIK